MRVHVIGIGAHLLWALASVASAQQRAGAQPLDTVRVTAGSRVSPSLASRQRSVEVIDRAAIDRRPARTITDVLATALGADVQSRSPAQADFALRGSSLGQVLVLVDGVRASDLQTAHFDLDLAVPLDRVERIEIVRGPASALHGSDAIGGIVNIVTRQGEEWQRARLHAGSFGVVGGAAGAARRAGAATLHAAVDAERSDGHRDGTDYDVMQASGGMERAVGAARLVVDATAASRNFGAADFYAPAPSYERTRTQALSVRLSDVRAGAWDIASSVAGRRHTDDFILRRADPAFYRNRHTTLQRSAELVAARQLGTMLRMAAGVTGFDAELASVRLGNRREQRAAAFTEAAFGRDDGASLTAGLRVDGSTEFGTFASPSVSAALPAGRHVVVRASGGRGLRAPSWTERHYVDPSNVGDPDLAVERFWTGEVGARATTPWGSVDVAAHVRQADALIDWIRPAGSTSATPWRTANLESATYRGLEVAIVVPDALGMEWRAGASGLHFEAAAAEGFEGKYALRPLTRIVDGSASRAFGERVRLSVDARWARREGEAAYLHVASRAALRIGWGAVRLDATNLAGASYLDASARPVAGRAFALGLQL